jgi:hypothetical protein
MDTKSVKRIASKEVKSHEKRLHPDAKKMRAGGKTNSDMLKMGRGLAKVANQMSSGRRSGRGG